MCTHPFAKEALTLHLARSEGHERYFGCNLMHRNVLAVWSKYSNAQRVSSLHLSEGCLNLASRSDTYFFQVRSSLPAARPAADLSQPCAPPVGLSPATRSPGVGSQLCLLFIHPRAPNLIGLRSAGTMPA